MNGRIDSQRMLSPRRNTSSATNTDELVDEQLQHFGIDPDDKYGVALKRVVHRMYESQSDIEELWQLTLASMNKLDQTDKIRRFNSQKFLSFQLAKLLDTLQHPFRKSYQTLGYSGDTKSSKGPYPVFDNVTALFSATPVITRTATYIYACADWIADAFPWQGTDAGDLLAASESHQRLPRQSYCRSGSRSVCPVSISRGTSTAGWQRSMRLSLTCWVGTTSSLPRGISTVVRTS